MGLPIGLPTGVQDAPGGWYGGGQSFGCCAAGGCEAGCDAADLDCATGALG